jgi:VIT1/CCC1 family predicted Fe2+/Mn2+ transporter
MAHSLHHALHEHRSVAGGLARAAVFGVSDGLVSNISLILGVAGGSADPSVVRLAGLAGLIAGAVSMAAGEYVSVSAQNELVQRELDVERRELHRSPEAETAELARIYESRGITRDLATAAARDVMRDHDKALIVHAREELGVDPDRLARPWLAALWSFVAFCIGAVLPLFPWFGGRGNPAKLASLSIGVVAATVVGVMIGRYAERSKAKSALRQVVILLVACGVTYLIGQAVGTSVG